MVIDGKNVFFEIDMLDGRGFRFVPDSVVVQVFGAMPPNDFRTPWSHRSGVGCG
jgi:hypothetical protein